MDNISVHLVQLPLAVKGVVSPSADGDYTIYINSLYNDVQRREIYDHEMRHILLGHYAQPDRPVTHQEAEASEATLLKSQIVDATLRGLPGRPLFARPAAPREASRSLAPTRLPQQGAPPLHRLQRSLMRQALTGAFY